MDELLKYMDIEMIPKEFGGKGVWEPIPGNVPKDFPFQMDEFVKDKSKHSAKENDQMIE